MKQIYSDRFNLMMASLRNAEPSASFDSGFKARLDQAVAERLSESFLETISRRVETFAGVPMLNRAPVFAGATSLIMALAVFMFTMYQPVQMTVTSTSGTVLYMAPGSADWKTADSGFKIKPGYTIKTLNGDEADIIADNKFALRLKENTNVKIASVIPRLGKGKAVFEMGRGAVMASIEKGFKPSAFYINTGNATTMALGTKYFVNCSDDKDSNTEIGVFEGKVKVESMFKPGAADVSKSTVLVSAGLKTNVISGAIPDVPHRLLESEWMQLDELYQIGRKPQIILIITNRSDRVMQLLKPCSIMISDDSPRVLPESIETAALTINEALENNDRAKHLEAIRAFEDIINKNPGAKYNVQLLLFVGAYYEYLDMHDQAIGAFDRILHEYSGSPLASMAQLAIGMIYDTKLHMNDLAKAAYNKVLEGYPDTLEAIWIEQNISDYLA